ncbi:MAG: MerR family transcriptional regulator [Treponema sp.]|nr:MerR family transcriptional regulator [Treponema sp.]
MKSYTAADAARLLRVKIHVIRYWEREIPLIQPRKDIQGKRLYSDRGLQLLLRLKYLLYERHFTVEGAREELYREISGERQDLRALAAALRSQLMELYLMIKEKNL